MRQRLTFMALLAFAWCMAFAASALGQEVTRTVDFGATTATITVTPERVIYDMPGQSANLSRDIIASLPRVGAYPHHAADIALLVDLAHMHHWPDYQPSDLMEALSEIEAEYAALAAQLEAREAQVAALEDDLAEAAAQYAALEAQFEEALRNVEGRIEELEEIEAEYNAARAYAQEILESIRRW